ncbi:MAG: MBOAT family protein [Oscillospiraceae bacterium]|nr:MBOAT family protein [Oscillospiraceae bacterium]
MIGKNGNRKAILTAAAILPMIAVLIFFKENSFFIDNTRWLRDRTGILSDLTYPTRTIPLGISYYTFLLVSYVLDVSWGKIEPTKNPFKIVLFAGYFPQMTSGPFTRFADVKNELLGRGKFNYENLSFGAQRFLWGLFKKLVLAERLAVIVASVYGNTKLEGAYIFIGAVSYVLQLYTDFSGCMDIVIGASQMFGIKLPENFKTPFYSTSLSEFWRRWHITLGVWLKDYVLYPTLKSRWLQSVRAFCAKRLGKKAGKDIATYIGMLITWFSIGFWHGGSWKYICSSGLFFFVMIVGGLLLEPGFKRLIKWLRINTGAWSWTLFSRMRTWILFTLSVSFGRAADLTDGFRMWRRAFKYNPWVMVDGSLYNLGLDAKDFWVMIFGLLILFIISKMQYGTVEGVRYKLSQQNIIFRWIVFLALFAAVLIFGMYGEHYDPADFIYGQF